MRICRDGALHRDTSWTRSCTITCRASLVLSVAARPDRALTACVRTAVGEQNQSPTGGSVPGSENSLARYVTTATMTRACQNEAILDRLGHHSRIQRESQPGAMKAADLVEPICRSINRRQDNLEIREIRIEYGRRHCARLAFALYAGMMTETVEDLPHFGTRVHSGCRDVTRQRISDPGTDPPSDFDSVTNCSPNTCRKRSVRRAATDKTSDAATSNSTRPRPGSVRGAGPVAADSHGPVKVLRKAAVFEPVTALRSRGASGSGAPGDADTRPLALDTSILQREMIVRACLPRKTIVALIPTQSISGCSSIARQINGT